MKEYTYTMTIEDVNKLISKGVASYRGVTLYTAEPPILPSWKIVELELSDVPKFIEEDGIFQFNELELSNHLTKYKTQTGEKIDFCIPNEVAKEIAQQINAQHKADYFAKVEQEFTRMKNKQIDRLRDSPDPERGMLIAAERWERILNGRDTDGLQKEEIILRTAWADITEGICYIGGQRHRDRRKALQLADPPYMANCGNGFAMEKKVDNQLRGIYIRARASYQFLQWLKELQAKPMADTYTSPQENKGGTGAEIHPKRGLTFKLDNTQRKELFDELMKYTNDWTSLLKILEGEHVAYRVKINCRQNEFAEVFKRLAYNQKITQPVADIVQLLCDCFDQKNDNAFNQRTIQDLFKPTGKPPKDRLCEFDWLTFKDRRTLCRDAANAQMNA